MSTRGSIRGTLPVEEHIVYSPDGKHVAIFNMAGLSLVHVDGSNLERRYLPLTTELALGNRIIIPCPHWSSDSSSLLGGFTRSG